MGQKLSREEFAYRLDREYRRKKADAQAQGHVYGLRTIARNIARRVDGRAGIDEKAATESWRRQIQRYMRAEHLPGREIRVMLADELGCSAETFGVGSSANGEESCGDDEDEDSAVDMHEALLSHVRMLKRALRDTEHLERQVRLAEGGNR